jgi:hypothetical protein
LLHQVPPCLVAQLLQLIGEIEVHRSTLSFTGYVASALVGLWSGGKASKSDTELHQVHIEFHKEGK